jgi:MoxR-like ATPase
MTLTHELRDTARLAASLQENLGRVVFDKPEAIRLCVAALLSGGHVLIEDAPGLGKTLLAKAIARSVGGRFARVQGTVDLLPSDVTGVAVFDPRKGEWTFRPGPLFHHVVLFDEINRATPRAQSALLEAMAEQAVTVDGGTVRLPDPFFLVATQNPGGDPGTFPLPAGQLDRFAVLVSMGRPGREAERELLLGRGGESALSDLEPVTDPAAVARARREVAAVHVSADVADYVVDLAEATRHDRRIRVGASVRASRILVRTAQGVAVTRGRDYVVPGDVQEVAAAVLGHRLVMSAATDDGATRVAELLLEVPAPVV